LNKEQNPEECDARDDDQRTERRQQLNKPTTTSSDIGSKT
jgi:hypothetical protein